MDDKTIELYECAGIEEKIKTLASRQLAGVVLALGPLGTSALLGRLVAATELLEALAQRCRYSPLGRSGNRASATTASPSSTSMTRTPWVARPMTEIPLTGIRITLPCNVITITSLA